MQRTKTITPVALRGTTTIKHGGNSNLQKAFQASFSEGMPTYCPRLPVQGPSPTLEKKKLVVRLHALWMYSIKEGLRVGSCASQASFSDTAGKSREFCWMDISHLLCMQDQPGFRHMCNPSTLHTMS